MESEEYYYSTSYLRLRTIRGRVTHFSQRLMEARDISLEQDEGAISAVPRSCYY